MLASQAAAPFDHAISLLHPFPPSSPGSTSSAVLRAIAEMDRETRPPTFTSAHEYIDPKGAPSPRSAEPFGAAIFASSHYVHTEDEQPLCTGSNLHPAVLPQPDFIFSSCDEDADGEPDESFQSEHSFWMSHPGDTSASTIATLAADEPPIPLLGRDGTWKGVPLQRSPARDHHQDTLHEQCDDSQQSLPLDGVDQTKEPSLLYSAPTRRTRQQRSFVVSSSNETESSRAAAKKRKHEKEQDPLEQSESSKTRPQTRRTSNRRSLTSTPKRNTTSSRITRSNPRRSDGLASSEAGSLSGDRNAPSPSSSSGRYRLRKKDVVPQRSLAALLTPPRDKRAQTSGEAPKPSGDWLDQVDAELDSNSRAPLPPPPAESVAFEARVRKADETVNTSAELDELEEIPARTYPAAVREKGQRTFPALWQTHPAFPLLYQRYCVPSSVSPEVLEMLLRGLNYAYFDEEFQENVDRAQSVLGAFNKPRSILDLYTPRFVKGVGAQKVGMCPVCFEDGNVKFLKTKFSAYNYHMQNFHGISALTGLPFTPPIKFTTRSRPNAKPKERKELVQGLCHSCQKYIDIQGPKETEVKVAEIYWWKHAQVCHRKAAVPEGVGGYFVENKWFERVCSVLELIDGFEGEVKKLLAGAK